MEPEAVLNLLDSSWFYLKIFEKRSNLSTSDPEPNADRKNQENSAKERVSRLLTIHTRSKSEQMDTSLSTVSTSPNSVLHIPHLQTILSEKEISQEIPNTSITRLKKSSKGFKKTRKGFSKSLSELEFEELKGFMDLGFVFSEEDKDSSLVEIIPGLQRLGQKMGCEENGEKTGTIEESCGPRARPYLSEAWEMLEKRKGESPLMSWRVPTVSNEIVMKDSLKWWAHTVASVLDNTEK